MNFGKTLFARLMEFVPWTSFARIVARHGDDSDVRNLYCNDSFDVDLTNTVYALDATTIDLCLSLFLWALFRISKAAIKPHALSFEAGAFYVMDRGYLDYKSLFTLHQSGAFFVTRTKRRMNVHRVYLMKVDRNTGIICNQRIALDGFYISQDYPEQLRRIRFKDPKIGKTLVFLTNTQLCLHWRCRTIFEKNQLQQALQGVAYIPELCGAANQLNLFNS